MSGMLFSCMNQSKSTVLTVKTSLGKTSLGKTRNRITNALWRHRQSNFSSNRCGWQWKGVSHKWNKMTATDRCGWAFAACANAQIMAQFTVDDKFTVDRV